MKKKWIIPITMLVPVFFFVFETVVAQNPVQNPSLTNPERPVLRGERPVPDYSGISDTDIHPGVVRIKISERFTVSLSAETIGKDPDGYVRFGIPGIDHLNRQLGVTGARKTFFIALRNTQFESRHQRWGLPLWYDLSIGQGKDVRSVMELYAALPEVERAELLVKATLASVDGLKAGSFTPNDSLYLQQWHYHNTGQAGGTPGCDISLPEAWELEKGDTGVIVSIMDQGVDFMHPDLEANIWPGIGYNFYADTSLIEACLHGTHVAGTIAANTNNGKGVSGVAGGDG